MSSKRRGLALLSQVYEELYSSLGEDAEPLQLLEAAQILIDLADDPHKFSKIDEGRASSNYYSWDTSSKIEAACWDILAKERINSNLDDRDFERGWQARLRSRSLREGISDDD